MAAVAVASPRDSPPVVDLQTGRRILVGNTANLLQLTSPKLTSSSNVASPKSPLGDRKMVLHPKLFRIVKGEKDFSAKLVAVMNFKAGDTIIKIEGITKGVAKRYTSVQSGVTEHFELNSDLVFMNHSCSPNVHMNVDKMEITALKDVAAGDDLLFFYPSTEWSMEQPFQCWCGADECVGWVAGAKYLSAAQLNQYHLNKHIEDLVASHLSQHQ